LELDLSTISAVGRRRRLERDPESARWWRSVRRHPADDRCDLHPCAIPSTLTRKIQHAIDQTPYALRNRIERFFNRAKHSRRVAAHHDKLIESFATLVLLACIPIWIKFVHAA
jgi:transposase